MTLIKLALILGFLETAAKWIADNYPGLFLLLIVGLGVWFITRQWDKFYNRYEKTEGQCDDLRSKYIPDLHSKFSGIDKKLGNVLTSLNNINTFLTTTSEKFKPLFASHSPIQLTDFGTKILVETGAKKYIDENLTTLVVDIELKNFKSGLDVQNYSYSLLTERFQSDSSVELKNYIYRNPIFKSEAGEIPLNISLLVQLMGIYLRNKYFDKHPELNQDL